MFIISKFRDYYDTAIGYGIDKTIVYNRAEEMISSENKVRHLDYEDASFVNKEARYSFYTYYVGFCGTIYPVVKVHINQDFFNQKDIFFYNKEDFKKFLVGLGVESKRGKYRFDRYKLDKKLYRKIYITNENSIDDFYDSKYPEYEKLFLANKIPLFTVRQDLITLNGRLQDFNFQTIKDPFTAFQDIQMYISGVIGAPERPMVQISDKDLAHKKGHGGKYSFKKMPEKK